MALTVKSFVSVDIAAADTNSIFKSNQSTINDTSSYSEAHSITFVLPNGATDFEVDFGAVDESSLMFLKSDKALTVRLVQPGGSLVTAQPFIIAPFLPAVLPFRLAELYVSNASGASAVVTLGMCGDNTVTGGPVPPSLAAQFNALLAKLDDDTGVTDTDYESTLSV